jgi:hypothetical protein
MNRQRVKFVDIVLVDSDLSTKISDQGLNWTRVKTVQGDECHRMLSFYVWHRAMKLPLFTTRYHDTERSPMRAGQHGSSYLYFQQTPDQVPVEKLLRSGSHFRSPRRGVSWTAIPRMRSSFVTCPFLWKAAAFAR